MYKSYSQRLNKLLERKEVIDYLDKGDVKSLFSKLNMLNRLALASGIAEVGENPFEQWGFTYVDKTTVNLQKALEHLYSIADNFTAGDWLGNIDGDEIVPGDNETLESRIKLAKLMGFEVHKTKEGYWVNGPDALAIKPGFTVMSWFKESDPEDETFEEWFNRVKPVRV